MVTTATILWLIYYTDGYYWETILTKVGWDKVSTGCTGREGMGE